MGIYCFKEIKIIYIENKPEHKEQINYGFKYLF